MNINKLVESIKSAEPGLAKVSSEDARTLVSAVFQHIRKEIDRAGEGVVKVPKLGRFRIKAGEREKDGRRVAVKRIQFKPVNPKA